MSVLEPVFLLRQLVQYPAQLLAPDSGDPENEVINTSPLQSESGHFWTNNLFCQDKSKYPITKGPSPEVQGQEQWLKLGEQKK